MSRVPVWTLSALLDQLQGAGRVPTVNPRRGGPQALWADLPLEVGWRGAIGYLLATLACIVFVALTWMITSQGAPTFIYQQF
jgi:hypothetical protein